MARKPRVDRPGCLHHGMGRGNAGGEIFKDGEDRQAFLRLLGDGVERFGHSVHAYCLMGNHFHNYFSAVGINRWLSLIIKYAATGIAITALNPAVGAEMKLLLGIAASACKTVDKEQQY